jgi:hypothetical protein
MKRAIMGVMCASALIGVGVGSCNDDDAIIADTGTYDSYLYYGYYPADVYYSGYYWTDPYYYYYAAAPDPYGGGRPTTGIAGNSGGGTTTGGAGSTGTTGAGGSGGGTTTTSRASDSTVGDVLRALARGETVCGDNQVSITPMISPDACATDGTGMSRSGVSVAFNGCELSNGSRLDGTIDVQGTRTLSDPACGPGTMVTFTAMTTITNLSRTTPSGMKIVMPSSNGTTTTNYIAGELPSSVAMTMNGNLQLVGPAGATSADRSFTGDVTLVPSADRTSYTTDGTITLQDAADSTSTTLTAQGLNRSASCCRPTGGTLTINRTAGANSGTHNWMFGPSCGAMMFDGAAITAPACL